MTVHFEEANYEFLEGTNETNNICVVSLGASDIPFTVTLSTLNGTATGMVYMNLLGTYPSTFPLAAEDYRVIDGANLTFEVSETRVCMEIILINDAILESDEVFTLLLASSMDSVLISTSSCTITVVDDDGGCPFNYQ